MAMNGKKLAILREAQQLRREARVAQVKGILLELGGQLTANPRVRERGRFLRRKGNAEWQVAAQVEEMMGIS